jgi:O-antigen ligase
MSNASQSTLAMTARYRSRFARRVAKEPGRFGDQKEVLSGAFFWLSAFYVVYCLRPQELIPGLGWLPAAKLAGAMALLGLALSLGRAPRRPSDLPREAYYLLALVGVLFVSAILSPVWRGGAFWGTLEFSKVCVLWVLAFLLITDLARLRRIVAIQAGSVVLISFFALVKGYSVERLNGVIGGIYSNPNDLAFAILVSMPLCLALLLMAKRNLAKAGWLIGMLVMAVALLRTASRGGFIAIMIVIPVCLWHFGVKGRRYYLLVASALIGTAVLLVAGGTLRARFVTLAGDRDSHLEEVATASYEERKFLMERALEGISEHPLLGVGAWNFITYSGVWLEVHAAYLQIAVEGGIPSLILYLLFFARGFSNLRAVRKQTSDEQAILFAGALHASLIGFLIGAAFSPEAYHFFPYFTVCYSSVLLAILMSRKDDAPALPMASGRRFSSARSLSRPSRLSPAS